jgi:hypothetical protein
MLIMVALDVYGQCSVVFAGKMGKMAHQFSEEKSPSGTCSQNIHVLWTASFSGASL